MSVPWFNIVVAIGVGIYGGVWFWRPLLIELNEKLEAEKQQQQQPIILDNNNKGEEEKKE